MNQRLDGVGSTYSALDEAWLAVGNDLRQAIGEVASAISPNDEDLAVRALGLAGTEPSFPNPAALELLIANDPEAGEHVLARTEEISALRHQAEISPDNTNHRFRRTGRMILRGFASIGAGMSGLNLNTPLPRSGRSSK